MSKMAFLFPGQGSQSKGMLAELIADETVVANTFAEASDVLGYDMKALVIDDADGKLDQTEFTQPALLTASTSLYRLWNARGGTAASQMAGHSLGEYSALVAAGAIAFEDAVALVAESAELMVIGGSTVYQMLLPQVDRMYITYVDGEFKGDAWFPDFDESQWLEKEVLVRESDENNLYNCRFVTLERK